MQEMQVPSLGWEDPLEKKIASESVSCSVMSDSLQSHGLQPARLLCPWDSPGKNTGVGSHFLLQGIFQIQGSNLGLLHCKQILYHRSHQGSSNPLQYSCLGNPMERGAWQATVHGGTKKSDMAQWLNNNNRVTQSVSDRAAMWTRLSASFCYVMLLLTSTHIYPSHSIKLEFGNLFHCRLFSLLRVGLSFIIEDN